MLIYKQHPEETITLFTLCFQELDNQGERGHKFYSSIEEWYHKNRIYPK